MSALATLRDFAAVNDAAAATPKKLIKQKVLADYLQTLDESDLKTAVRYAGGRAFPSTSERVLGVSWSIVSDVILSMIDMDARAFHALVVKSGEVGEALSAIWDYAKPAAPVRDSLTLEEMSHAFEDLASTGNQQRKKEIVRDLLTRTTLPREAAYLAKIIFSDLRTGVREGVLQAAVAQAFGKTTAEIQKTQLLVGDLDEVAILAKRNELHTAHFTLFHPIQFMLATPEETADDAAKTMDGRAFYSEDKLDGIRAQIHKTGEGHDARIAIYTRTMDRTDDSFPDVVASIRKLPGEFLLDGEIVPYRDGKVLPFAHIQKRLGRKVFTPKILRDNPAVFIAFDILYRDGELLMERPLKERRDVLHHLACFQEVKDGETNPPRAAADAPRSNTCLLITAVTEVREASEIDRTFCTARDCGNEGLVLKDPDSIYSPGRRGKAWLKIKTHLPTIDCVVTAAEYGHGKRRNSLSDYTFAVWDVDPATNENAKLVNIGKAYSGVTDAEIAQLTELFLKLAIANNGRVFQVEPKIVLEIACDQIQPSERHASGYALRFPRIKRIRWDKNPIDAERLSRVIEIYQSTSNTARREVEPEKPKSEPTLFD